MRTGLEASPTTNSNCIRHDQDRNEYKFSSSSLFDRISEEWTPTTNGTKADVEEIRAKMSDQINSWTFQKDSLKAKLEMSQILGW